MDFDGDTGALYCCHTDEALQEMNEKAFLKNRVHYEQNKMFLSVVRHEALYGAYILTLNLTNVNKLKIFQCISSLDNLEEDIDFYNENLYDTIYLSNEQIYTTYGNALLNKWCGFKTIILNEEINKKNTNEISRWVYKNVERDSEKFYNNLDNLDKLLYVFVSTTNHSPTININDMINILTPSIEQLFKKITFSNVWLGYYLNKSLIERTLIQSEKDNNLLFKLYNSGSRFNKIQLAKSCINNGYISDQHNIILDKPINTNLLKGMSEKEFFSGSPGTRKGIADKSTHTPQSGYLERTVVMALSVLEITNEDCGTQHGIETIIFSRDHAKSLSGKYYKNPLRPGMDWEVINYKTAISLLNKKIIIRSPITCEEPNLRMCRMCFGDRARFFKTKYLGLVAGSNLIERLTQLIMRSFHISGSSELDTDPNLIKYFTNNLKDIAVKNNQIFLTCDNIDDIPQTINIIEGYQNIVDDQIIFNEVNKEVINKDTITLLKVIKNLLKKHKKINKTPSEYYNEFISGILSVGVTYSSFVEMLFANSFISDYDKKEFWRYNQDKQIQVKLGDKGISKFISNLLGLLYEPNKESIKKLSDDFKKLEYNPDTMTIYEKIWFSEL